MPFDDDDDGHLIEIEDLPAGTQKRLTDAVLTASRIGGRILGAASGPHPRRSHLAEVVLLSERVGASVPTVHAWGCSIAQAKAMHRHLGDAIDRAEELAEELRRNRPRGPR